MSGFAVLMFIFGVCTLLVGFYMFTGHALEGMTWKAQFQNLKKDDWKNIGKWTMVVSIFIFLLALLGWVFNF